MKPKNNLRDKCIFAPFLIREWSYKKAKELYIYYFPSHQTKAWGLKKNKEIEESSKRKNHGDPINQEDG